jgi:hypothetical protein
MWGSAPRLAAAAKNSLVHDETDFEEMLAGFKEELTKTDAVRNVARKARTALWPHTRLGGRHISWEELGVDEVRESAYKEFIAAFEIGDGWTE